MPAQTAALPDIAPGCAGVEDAVTASVLAVPVPQLFEAVTEIFPEEEPAVTLIELVVEEPVHPDGNVHV